MGDRGLWCKQRTSSDVWHSFTPLEVDCRAFDLYVTVFDAGFGLGPAPFNVLSRTASDAFNLYDLMRRSLHMLWTRPGAFRRPFNNGHGAFNAFDLIRRPFTRVMDWARRLSTSFHNGLGVFNPVVASPPQILGSFGLELTALRRSSLGPPFSLPSVPTHSSIEHSPRSLH